MSTVERKGVIAFIVIGLLTVLGGSAAAAPHHPLSQIYPMDVDLNLSGQDINELGDLRLAGGSATVDGTINMSGNEIVEYVTDARSGAPTSPAAGQMWFDSGQNVLKYYNGTNWVITASASSVSSDLQSVLGAGNSAGSYDLNMSGNSILSVEHMTSKTGSHIYVRKREAENQASNCGTDVTDTNASGGAARSSSGCGSGGGLFSWGPYWQVPPGNYQVIWRLKTSDATSSSRQVCVRATGGDGKEACLSGNDFDAAGQYQIVTTPLRFTTDSSDIELYARDYGAATITLDAITIRAATSGLGAQHFGNVDLNNNDINSVGRINADGGLLAGGTGQSIGIGTNEVGRDPIGNLSDWQTSWVLADGGLGGYKRNLYFQDNQGNVVMRFGATGGINMYGNQISGVSQVTLNNGAYIDEGTADYGDIRVGGRCESGWCGINIQGQSDYVLMTDESGTDDVGLYADDPNNWLWRYDASKNHKDNYKDIDMNKNQLKRVTSVSSRIIEVNGAKMENFEGASEQSDGDMSGGDWGTWVNGYDNDGGETDLSGNYIGSQGLRFDCSHWYRSPNINNDELQDSVEIGRVYLQAWVRQYNDNEETYIDISTDGGSSWQVLQVNDNNDANNEWARWSRISIDITSYVNTNPASTIYIRFREGGGGCGDQMNVDAVQLIHKPNSGPWNYGFDGDLSYNGGNVGIGTYNPGSKLDVAGNCVETNGACADIAEVYNASEPVESGDIVMTDTTKSETVEKATRAGRDNMLGVVTTAPAMLFEESHQLIGTGTNYSVDPMQPGVALVGRVPVKVNLANGPIEIGDPITVSPEDGVGMEAESAGMVVGTALEPYNASSPDEKIMVFVNPRFHADGDTVEGLKQKVAKQQRTIENLKSLVCQDHPEAAVCN